MLIDILNSNNYISYNITIAQIYGLKAAIYVSELLNIYKKVQIKNKFVDGDYINVNRKYVFQRTTLTIEEQLVVEQNLMKLDIIKKHADNEDVIKFDFEKLVSLAITDDLKKIKEISDKVSTDKPKGIRESKRNRTKQLLKDGIICPNYELLTALRNWIDCIYAGPNGYLSKTAVDEFVKGMNEYSKGNLDVSLKLVKIASIQGYKNIDFAIAVYEKDQKLRKSQEVNSQRRINRVTTQKVSTQDDVDGDVVF